MHLVTGVSIMTEVVMYTVKIFLIRTWCLAPGRSHRWMLASPVEQPDLLGAGQSVTELLFLRGVAGALELVPNKFPLFLPARSHSSAIDCRPQVGVDAESHKHSYFPNMQDDPIFKMSSWTSANVLTHFCACVHIYETDSPNESIWLVVS